MQKKQEMKPFTLRVLTIAFVLVAFLAAVREAPCQGLSERLASYRKQAAKAADPVAVWIAAAEKDEDEDVRLEAVHELRKYPDDPRVVPALQRLAAPPPRRQREAPVYPTSARNTLYKILGDKEWRQLQQAFPKPADLVAPAKAAFRKTTNPVLRDYCRQFLTAQGDEDSIMFLIDEDTETLNEGLCSAIAARIDGGHDKLYHVCLGFFSPQQGPGQGAFF